MTEGVPNATLTRWLRRSQRPRCGPRVAGHGIPACRNSSKSDAICL